MSELPDDLDIMAGAVGRTAGANLDVIAALLSILMRESVLSPQIVREGLCCRLRSMNEGPAQQLDQTGQPTPEALRATATLRAVEYLEEVLFQD
jgi:hypothetical protein